MHTISVTHSRKNTAGEDKRRTIGGQICTIDFVAIGILISKYSVFLHFAIDMVCL